MGQRVEAKRRGSRSGGGMPAWLLPVIGGLILGVVLGYVIGWSTVSPVNTNPGTLNLGAQRTWIEMAADSLAVSDDSALARLRILGREGVEGFFTPEQAASLLADRITAADQVGDLARSQRLRQLADAIGVDPTTAAPLGEGGGGGANMLGTIFIWCGGAILLLALLGGGALLATRLRQGGTTPARSRASSSTRNKATVGTPPAPRKPPAERSDLAIPDRPSRIDDDDDSSSALDRLFDDTADAVDEASFEPTREVDFAEPDVAPVRYSPALDEFITRYNYGDDGFDMSFSIETPQVEFLGECGVGISDTVNEGTPQQVTAFEVWLFDKDDIRTVTKVLLSDHAWNNEELRSRLGPKGELIHARAGETVDLETKSLRVRARIREVEYGSSGPDNAYFDRLVVELTPQQKQ